MKKDLLTNFLRSLERLYQACRVYPAGHAQISVAAEKAADLLKAWGSSVRMSMVGRDLIVEDRSIHHLGERLRFLSDVFEVNGWDAVRIAPSSSGEDILEWVGEALRGARTPFHSARITAGRLDMNNDADQVEGEDPWPNGYAGYVPDTNRALEQLDSLSPEGLQLARNIVRSISGRLARDPNLLTQIRKLKEFDEYTYTHALNVSIVSMAIARRLGVAEELTQVIALGGLCHDLGKARVPREILNKSGRLEEKERLIINRHPVEGAKTLLAVPGRIHPLLPTIAHQHHMHPDASGYPEGPGGASPHPASQLVEVADVFDALRTVRPYRDTLSEVDSMNILLAEMHAGKLHRGAVVALAAVLELLDEGTPVRLQDGREAFVVTVQPEDYLQPMVETDRGDILDLSDPTLPAIEHFIEPLDCAETALTA